MQRFSHHKINLSLIEFESLNIKDFFYKNEISMKTSKIFPISVRTSKVSRSMIQRQFQWLLVRKIIEIIYLFESIWVRSGRKSCVSRFSLIHFWKVSLVVKGRLKDFTIWRHSNKWHLLSKKKRNSISIAMFHDPEFAFGPVIKINFTVNRCGWLFHKRNK